MSLGEYLKRNIPEFQQKDSPLTAYLDVSGDFLGEMKEAITQFDYHRDWKKGSELSVDMTTKQRGFNLPSNMSYSAKRVFLRDIAEVIKRNGTEDGLLHALKMIGYDAEVRAAWIPCADRLEQGYYVDIETCDERYYELNRQSYRDFLYGNEVVTDRGVYFSGFRYIDDFLRKNEITDIPISGEIYEEYKPTNLSVTKTPYVVVRLKNGDFNVDVNDYVNPITGKSYKYSSDEEFQLVNDIVEFFIKNGYRATTIRSILIAFLQQFDDTLTISDTFNDNTYYDPDGGDDLADASEFCENGITASRVYVDGSIGSNMGVGSEIPYESPLSIVKPLPIGMYSDYVNEKFVWSDFTNTISLSLANQYPDFLVRYNTEISLSNTSSVSIDVYINGEFFDSVNSGDIFEYTTDHTIHAVRITPSNFIEEVITVNFNFNKFDQQNKYDSINCSDILVDELKELDDSFSITDSINQEYSYKFDEDSVIEDSISTKDIIDNQGNVLVVSDIGGNMTTGTQIPYASPISIINPLPIGIQSAIVDEIYDWAEFTQTLSVGLEEQHASILLRYNTIVQINNTSTTPIDVLIDDSIYQIVEPNSVIALVTTHTMHKLTITPSLFTNEAVNIALTFNQFNQNSEDL
jgi:hypothetical protein